MGRGVGGVAAGAAGGGTAAAAPSTGGGGIDAAGASGAGGLSIRNVEVVVRQAKGLRLLDVEVWNSTDVVFDVSVLLLPASAIPPPPLPRRKAAAAAAGQQPGAAAGNTGGNPNSDPSLLRVIPPCSEEEAEEEEAAVVTAGGSISRTRIDRGCVGRLLVPLSGFDLGPQVGTIWLPHLVTTSGYHYWCTGGGGEDGPSWISLCRGLTSDHGWKASARGREQF